MKKIILLLAILILFGCKTKYILTENTRNTKDSVENVQLKQSIQSTEKELTDAKIQLKVNEKLVSELAEKYNLSETEKQQLRETFETVVKEYNEQGMLVKESYSKRTSELIKDISKLEEQNKNLTGTINTQTELISHYTSEITRVSDMNVELNKKVQLLEQENSDLKSVKKSKAKFAWWLLIIGFAGGVAFYYYFESIVGFIIKFIKK